MANTKGTSSIDSPKGGGALAGLGEKFSPDLFTGTGNFSVPIAVPPGRNGFQPELSIGYSSGNGNGAFGMGWALGIPGVTRKTSKGIPLYDDKNDIFILSGAEDLVPIKIENIVFGGTATERTTYRPRTEGLFARIERYKKSTGEHYWKVWSKDGLISFYGSESYMGSDPCVLANPEKRDSIFAWHLSKTIDPFGNVILYEYLRDIVTTGDRPYDQLYISSIKYAQYLDGVSTKYLCEVRFNYEDRIDPFSAYKQGFEVRTSQRCKSLETYTNAVSEIKTRTYHFNYTNDGMNATSVLKEVSVEGHNGIESEFMPPLTFGYSDFNPQKRELYPIKGQLPAVSLADPGFELADLDGNGLPDILQLNGIARRWPNQGFGKFGPPLALDIAPSVNLSMPGVQLIDADGDGKSDLLVNDGVKAGFFSGRFRTVWDNKSFRPYPQVPSFSFADPEVRLIDLDGDGVTDVLRNGARFECFFNDPEKGFYKTRLTAKTFADFSFADPRIRFADMTGDGMQDIVFISSGKVQYWPNLGYGRFGNKVVMRNAPRFPEEYDPAQILLGDLDGDGLTDLAYVENNQVWLYINQSGNGFSEGSVIKGTPRVQTPNALRIADMLGTGQSGILWSYGAGESTAGQMFFLDFTAGNKPYLLQEMNNNMGSLTRVSYGSSVYHYLRDEANPATRWQTDLPFPVLVVNKVEVLDLLSSGKLVTEYLYHHGYWDGAEREFRGFARVDARDTESFEKYNTADPLAPEFAEVQLEHYTPPTETRNWFYPGPVGDGYGKWFEVDFTHEYWNGDAPYFERSLAMTNLLASLPRRARRDALRTLRGTMLRSELYALDNSALSKKPYTVTESIMDLRLEFNPSQLPAPLWAESQGGYSAGGGYIFFPFNTAQRSTQWERGDDPMHSFSFTQAYDAYGQALGQMSIGVPRNCNPKYGGTGQYLATYGISEYIEKVSDTQYMVTRVKKSVSYDATKSANGLSVFGLRDGVFGGTITTPVIGCTLNFYDGAAFVGLPYGEIGDFGALVRSESLIITDDIISETYDTGVPECFKASPDWVTDYPAAFEGLLQNNDERLGYKDRRFSLNYEPGWYAEGAEMKYDFHDSPTNFVGLVIETRDTFQNISSVEYDYYKLLPVKKTDSLGLISEALYDYRVLMAYRIIDPNQNISEFDFSPLGLLKATALIGKGEEGDYKQSSGTFYERFVPSTIHEYDFFAFTHGNPVWAKTIDREKHYQDEAVSPTITQVSYSDGFGRLLQTRAQAADIIFGDSVFGNSGLPADQTMANANAIGKERDSNDPLNVIVSGWQVYNNKGSVVEAYEPYYDNAFEYNLPSLNLGSNNYGIGAKIKTYYDPRGQVVRTVNPDDTQQRIIFGIPTSLANPDVYTPTPWESYAYDANDLAPLTHPNDTLYDHHFTPKSVLLDAMGRSIRTTEHIDKTNIPPSENIIMQYQYDIRGNLLKVIDPLLRITFKYVYDFRTPGDEGESLAPIRTEHLDSGISTVLLDSLGKTIKNTDSKNAQSLSSYDVMNRPIFNWACNNGTDTLRLVSYTIYGEYSPTPFLNNLQGMPWISCDESGKTEAVEFDFKGNLLSKKIYVISSTTLKASLDNYETFLVDWTGFPSITESVPFEMDSQYDALNRVIKITLPENVDGDRKEISSSYNRAGDIEKIDYDGDEYIRYIAYNARGQRLLTAFGNDVMTRYAYDKRNFRLLRQRSEKYTYSHVGDYHNYDYDSGNKRQDDGFRFDLNGNILKIMHRLTDCGISSGYLGSNELDRTFTYDAMYRISSATGRESDSQNENLYIYSEAPIPGSPNASNVRAYTREYFYDKLGNVERMEQSQGNDFTRKFVYNTGVNTLQKITTASNSLIEDYTYDSVGNQLTAGSTRNYVWNAANRMVTYYNQVSAADPTIYAQYDYDADGNRVSKMVRTGTNVNPIYERTIYIDGIFEYHIRENSSTLEKNYVNIMDNDSCLAVIRIGDKFPDDIDEEITYNLQSQIGSCVARLDDGGGFIDKEEYYPFGDSSLRTFSKKRYRYVGKEKDLESGLYYYGARYYAAWTCRFISVDPLAGQYANLTPYNYAGNKPITYIDIDGMQSNGDSGTGQSVPRGGSNNFDNPINGGTLKAITITATRPTILQSFWGGIKGRVTDGWEMFKKYSYYSAITSFQEGKVWEGLGNLTGHYNMYRFWTENWQGMATMPIQPLMVSWEVINAVHDGNWNRLAYIYGGQTFDAAVALAGAKVPAVKLPPSLKLPALNINVKIPSFSKPNVSLPPATLPTTPGLRLPIYKPNFALKPQYTNGSFKFAVAEGSGATKGVLNPNEIYFMQSSIKNTTGNFTVLGNAEALANGSLNPNVLRMNVWKDATGKVWTLDHRRLGAFKLSGLEQAPIQWTNPSGQMWKMTTTNGGTSIKLKLGGGNSMIIK